MIKGVTRILYINDIPVGCLTSNSLSEQSETINTTTRDNGGWETSRPTNQSYSISFDGEDTDRAGVFSYLDLRSLKRSKSEIEWQIRDVSGVFIDSGNGYISSINQTSPSGELITFSGEITGNLVPLVSGVSVTSFDSTLITWDSTLLTFDNNN